MADANDKKDCEQLLYSSSEIFNRNRLYEKEKMIKVQNQRKTVFSQQFEMDESQSISSQEMLKDREQQNNQSFGAQGIEQIQKAHLNWRQLAHKCKTTELGTEQQQFLRKVLFQKGYLSWEQHKAELPQIIKTIQKRKREKESAIPTNSSTDKRNISGFNISFQKQSNIWVKDFEQKNTDYRNVQKSKKKGYRYEQYDKGQADFTDEETHGNIVDIKKQKKFHMSSSAFFSSQTKNNLLQAASKSSHANYSEGKSGNKKIQVQQYLNRIFLSKQSSHHYPYQSSSTPIFQVQNGSNLTASVEHVSDDHLYCQIGPIRVVLFFGWVDLIKLSETQISIILKSGSCLSLIFQGKNQEMIFLEKILRWTQEKPKNIFT